MEATLYLKRMRVGDLESFIRLLNDNEYDVKISRKGTVSTRIDITKNEPKVKVRTIQIEVVE